MNFPYGKDIKIALKEIIKNSIEQRKIDACDTWNVASVLANAWGVKEKVEFEMADEVRSIFKSIEGKNIELDSGETVTILKGDVRERKEVATLIFRYKLSI